MPGFVSGIHGFFRGTEPDPSSPASVGYVQAGVRRYRALDKPVCRNGDDAASHPRYGAGNFMLSNTVVMSSMTSSGVEFAMRNFNSGM
jgi:hypothetical protein